MLNNFSINKKKLKAKTIIKIVSIFCIVFAFIFGFYFWFKNSNLSTILTDMQKLKEWILSFGFWSYFVFVILQFLQVTFLPLPSSLTTLTGVVIFGPFYTFLLSTLSIMLGSIFAYLLGKTFGIKFLNLIFFYS